MPRNIYITYFDQKLWVFYAIANEKHLLLQDILL